MTSQKLPQRIIPKEDAVFWMDKNGAFWNEHGKFEHPKIIKHFNSSIRKDDTGFYLYQKTDEYEEKVYFKYEDTALFVTDIKVETRARLKLNNNEIMELDPKALFTRDDSLFIKAPDGLIKFSSNALLKLSKFMGETEGRLFLVINKETYWI
jgi:hypothetical protein